MNKKVFAAAFTFLLLAIGYSTLASAGVSGEATPIITQSFASQEVRPGDTWKIYLKASHPEGKMKNIFVTVRQAGVAYPVSIIRIKKENQQDLSGFIYLNTVSVVDIFNLHNLNLSVQIQDQSGHFSPPAVFDVAFNYRYVQAAPQKGIFREQQLGPVMIQLQTIGGDSPN